MFWALATVIVWSVPIWHGQRGLRLHPANITERHGLVVIVVLGESVVAIGLGARGLPINADLLLAAILGLVVCARHHTPVGVHRDRSRRRAAAGAQRPTQTATDLSGLGR